MLETSEDNLPLITCIMPTFNRRDFVPRAITFFLRQDYTKKELVIVDDGSDPVSDLIPRDDRIRYIRLSARITVGAKRNLACEQARGEIIAHWDDDDWHAPDRLSYQTNSLIEAQADVCGLTNLLFYDLRTGKAWQYIYPQGLRFWLAGSSLCYRRDFWANHRFREIDIGEDTRFVWSGQPDRMLILPRCDYHVGMIHDSNISPKPTRDAYWHPYPPEEIQTLLGNDWHWISKSPPLNSSKRVKTTLQTDRSEGNVMEQRIPKVTEARHSDLDLPEFAAFNHGQSLPWMRRWEMPFAIYQSQLTNTMAILNCTINPVNFQERLALLYPDVHYRYWNPVQNGKFTLPFGFPDEAFDRVFCINTLEHLLRSQREALIQSLAGKLKPGGWLVLTSDYYFDSFWSDPVFLNAGVMRANQQEIFKGWNKVTPHEWLDLCNRNGLQLLDEMIPDPNESDQSLYRQQPPFPHACIGGVFVKPPTGKTAGGVKVALAMLTWNTSQVSIESVRAYLREARMLRRLGQTPFLCVCDNGSNDSTPEYLREIKSEIDFDYQFIFNRENLGNSIARNQIIDAALDFGAKYLLFMDGDIEIVPFSSFAMLRYMENSGNILGSIGADSTNSTRVREMITPYLYSLQESQKEITNLVAYTNYGMFRCSIFQDGVRFDESTPFDQAGWGFEDNDLAFQMDVKGYLNQCFFGMTYLHRDKGSSIQIMKSNSVDVAKMFALRKQYVIEKWSSNPIINNGPLVYVRRVNMRF